ncbi:twin-arginine translocase subunit TatC [Candidatus Riflebacteria bacterium]
MSFIEHLDDLRNCILSSLFFLFFGILISYYLIDAIFKVVIFPFKTCFPDMSLVTLQVTEGFFTTLKLSGYSGLIGASPFILYQIWKFVSPALFDEEKKYIYWLLPLSCFCFFFGVFFAFFTILPFALKFLVFFSADFARPQISLAAYVSFVGNMLLVFGIAFQLPLVIIILTKIGLVQLETLRIYRKHNILAAFIVSALLTPPDPFTQVLMAMPLVLLYELGIIFAWMVTKKSRPELPSAQ